MNVIIVVILSLSSSFLKENTANLNKIIPIKKTRNIRTKLLLKTKVLNRSFQHPDFFKEIGNKWLVTAKLINFKNNYFKITSLWD